MNKNYPTRHLLRLLTSWRIALLVAIFSGFVLAAPVQAAPYLANYYLGTLPVDPASIHRLAQHDVLIVGAEQAVVRRDVLAQIKQQNPDIILLAYVLSTSLDSNWQRYPQNAVWRDFTVADSCWLRDSRGNKLSNWPGQQSINMKASCADYLLGYVRAHVLSAGVWDGVFWDVVNDGISGTYADVDINEDGVRDELKLADGQWRERMAYFLEASRTQLPVKYIVINGSSLPLIQPHVNGRMYESYPTPWEAGGSWSGIMSKLLTNRKTNRDPRLYVFNANTNNTGRKNDYRRVRFGLGSSLLTDDVYFSFDHGTQDHAQLWWYDEYDVELGKALGAAQSLDGKPPFADGIWKREFERGVVVLNTTGEKQEIYLDAEYEKIIGTQDARVNDGSISDRVELAPRDGIILKKTAPSNQAVDNVPFGNGAFVRFYDSRGNRTLNGYFAFSEEHPGGTAVYHGDLDGAPGQERVVVTGPKLEIIGSAGDVWLSVFPFGEKYKGEIQFAAGHFTDGLTRDIAVSGTGTGGRVIVYNYYGKVLKNWQPLGKAYKNGLHLALGSGKLALGVGKGRPAEVLVYGRTFKLTKRFYPYGAGYYGGTSVAIGDVNADNIPEIITASQSGRTTIRTFGLNAKKLTEFKISGFIGGAKLTIAAADNDRDGHDEIVVVSSPSK